MARQVIRPRALIAVVLAGVAVVVVAGCIPPPTTHPGTTAPTTAAPLPNRATKVAAGSWGGCAVIVGGTVDCWGENDHGQAGNGSSSLGVTVATPVIAITNAVDVADSGDHSCALLSGGAVKCWGDNGAGQLGYAGPTGDGAFSATPVSVSGITNAIAVTVGEDFSCALLQAGAVDCWGQNDRGQLATGTAGGVSSSPVEAISTGATAIAAGAHHACALLTLGSVICWGDNDAGSLGDGSVDFGSPVPVQTIASGVTAIDAGPNMSCALVTGGGVDCWGLNDIGALGNGLTDPAGTPYPVAVIGLGPAMAISVGQEHACATVTGGGVYCWGRGDELGNGTTTNSAVPVQVSGISNVSEVSAGKNDTCALLVDGSVDCWGLAASSGEVNLTPTPVAGIAAH